MFEIFLPETKIFGGAIHPFLPRTPVIKTNNL